MKVFEYSDEDNNCHAVVADTVTYEPAHVVFWRFDGGDRVLVEAVCNDWICKLRIVDHDYDPALPPATPFEDAEHAQIHRLKHPNWR